MQTSDGSTSNVPVQKTRLSRAEQVYGHLRHLITNLELKPGHHLSENQLASWLGVSRTPVREALQRLRSEGLVQRSPTGGLIVAELTIRDVHETCDLLEMLDTYIFQRAAARLSEEKLTELCDCVRTLRTASREKDIDAWLKIDRLFHSILEEAAGNAQASELARQLRRRLHRFGIGPASNEKRLEACSKEHEEIAAAISSYELEALGDLVHEHVSNMRESLLRLLDDVASRPYGNTEVS